MIMAFYDGLKTKFQDESMNGLLSLFYVNGIDVKRRKSRKHRMTFLAILFHSVWLLATTANIWCLSDSMYSLHIFTILAKTVALAIWWTIRREAKNLHDLLKSLLCLLKHTGSKVSASTQMLARGLPWLMLGVSFLPAALWMASSSELKGSCFAFWVAVDSKILFSTLYFFLSALQQYVNWCMTYAAGVFFVCFCREVGRVATKLTDALGSGEDVTKLYRVLVIIVARLDRALSLAMLFSMTRCFMEFFRALTLYFQYSKDVHEIKFVFCGVFYTLESGLLYVSIVLFADKVQADCNVLRKCLLRDGGIDSSGVHTWKAIEKCSQLFEDKEDIKLSVWKMLRLKKKILFTTVTSLVTYGVILHQFHT